MAARLSRSVRCRIRSSAAGTAIVVERFLAHNSMLECPQVSGRSRLMWAIVGILLLVGLLVAIGTSAIPGVWDTLFGGGNV